MLSPYRVLDISDDKGTVCGKILAELGADVIKIEDPGGGKERSIGPFVNDDNDPEKSLFWFAFNRGKKGITLHLEDDEAKEIFKKLVSDADIVIESFQPGYLDSIGLGYSDLRQVNPGIVFVSISPFGQTGPYKDYKATDLVIMAMSGYMHLCGDSDRPPVRVSYPLAYGFAATEAATGSLIALYDREMTGKGQHVEVSAQEAVTEFTLMAPWAWDVMKRATQRTGRGGDLRQCKDGWVMFRIYGGQMGARMNTALSEWMESLGEADEFLESVGWEMLDMATVSREYLGEINEAVNNFFLKHTKAELRKGAAKRGINLDPVWTIPEILNSVQLDARNFYVEVDHPELGMSITYPGGFFISTDIPCCIGERAPLIGEHNDEIYRGKLGISDSELRYLKERKII